MGVKVAFQESAGESPPAGQMNGLLVPAAALRRENGRDYVLVVADGVTERRAVAAGDSRGGDIMISGGLAAGERVVVEGPPDLADGARIQEKGT